MKKYVFMMFALLFVCQLAAFDITVDGKTYKNAVLNRGKSQNSVRIYHDDGLKITVVSRLPKFNFETRDGEKYSDAKITALNRKGVDISCSGRIKFLKYRDLIPEQRKIFARKKIKKNYHGSGKPTKKPIIGRDLVLPKLGIRLIFIKKGNFKMGRKNGPANEKLHRVKISKPYWIGRNEITWKQYLRLMPVPEGYKKKFGDKKPDPSLPASYLSFSDALSFCEKLNEKEKTASRLLKGYVYRLPTEAEWEYAASGGPLKTVGSTSKKTGWFKGNADGVLHEPRKKSANAIGIFDLSGNIQEYCLDLCAVNKGDVWNGQYRDKVRNPLGGSNDLDEIIRFAGDGGKLYRVMRGGSIMDKQEKCSVSSRFADDRASEKLKVYGFRICLAPKLKVPEIPQNMMVTKTELPADTVKPQEEPAPPPNPGQPLPPGPPPILPDGAVPPPPPGAVPSEKKVTLPAKPPLSGKKVQDAKSASVPVAKTSEKKDKGKDNLSDAGKDKKEKTTGSLEKICPFCNGTKTSFGKPCPVCHGTGKVKVSK